MTAKVTFSEEQSIFYAHEAGLISDGRICVRLDAVTLADENLRCLVAKGASFIFRSGSVYSTKDATARSMAEAMKVPQDASLMVASVDRKRYRQGFGEEWGSAWIYKPLGLSLDASHIWIADHYAQMLSDIEESLPADTGLWGVQPGTLWLAETTPEDGAQRRVVVAVRGISKAAAHA